MFYWPEVLEDRESLGSLVKFLFFSKKGSPESFLGPWVWFDIIADASEIQPAFTSAAW